MMDKPSVLLKATLANSYKFAEVISAPRCTTCRDSHPIADSFNFANPLVGTTGGLGGEIYALSTLPPAAGTLNPSPYRQDL
jgi:hypothetical protein